VKLKRTIGGAGDYDGRLPFLTQACYYEANHRDEKAGNDGGC
jgi:hypothetical protein